MLDLSAAYPGTRAASSGLDGSVEGMERIGAVVMDVAGTLIGSEGVGGAGACCDLRGDVVEAASDSSKFTRPEDVSTGPTLVGGSRCFADTCVGTDV